MSVEKILELSNLIKEEAKLLIQKRSVFEEILTHSDKTFLGLCGPRGAGKTILLRQYLIHDNNSIYISLDSLASDFDLFEAVKNLSQSYNIKVFLLDEVHFNKHIDKHLKNIFDFLNVKIIFTSSVALKMFNSAQDLSRRVKLIKVPYFSLREFLYFKHNLIYKKISVEELLRGEMKPDYINCDIYLKEYFEGGVLPFALKVNDWKTALNNILKRVVTEDIPRVASITLEETELIFNAIKFIGMSAVDGINPTSLAKNLSVTHYKADQYLRILEQAFVVHRVMPEGTNVLKEPKILLNVPYRLLYSTYEQAIGGLREEYTVGMLLQLGVKINYIKNSRGKKMPDYIVELGVDLDNERIVIEVGGKSKNMNQLTKYRDDLKRFVFKEGPPYDQDRRPLSILGLLN